MTTDDITPDPRGAKLAALLSATDPPARALVFPGERIARVRRRRTLARALALTAVVLAAGALLVPPVRALIVDTARHLLAREPRGGVQEPRSGFAELPNRASFAVAGEQFMVVVATRQAAGALRFERSADDAVHAALTGDAAEAALVVLPSGLRIVNGSRVRMDYVIRLPATITRVQVRIGAEAARDVALDVAGRARVSLASEGTDAARSSR